MVNWPSLIYLLHRASRGDVLVSMGLLQSEQLGDWRRGRVTNLERVIIPSIVIAGSCCRPAIPRGPRS